MLPSIQGITNTQFDGGEVDVTFLEEYFKRNPNQKSARTVQKINGKLTENSKLLEIPNLVLRNSGKLSMFILERFNGRNLHLYNTFDCYTYDIVGFLREWVSGRGYLNLESLYISKSKEAFMDFDLTLIANEFNLTPHNDHFPRFYDYESV
ncbi:hypothetical protein CAEBREN_03097 [Caenorhabditis brenneri]|uniref:F-box associated domain-containing protein n=1 Tax=Caenorhabditis brenneri TaxID=135651 RepID=G0MLA5_CAEBE|nr:hypothetical protein CAEBREN_03097 [Caenorhabditis brenneri]